MNAVTPLARRLPGSVIANSRMYRATGPEVIQLFLPLITKLPSACLTARERIAVASEPDCGSVSANAPMASPDAIGVHVLVLLLFGAELEQAVAVQRIVDRS